MDLPGQTGDKWGIWQF